MSPRHWIALGVGVLALAAGLALSGGIYTAVAGEDHIYVLNRWTGSVQRCRLVRATTLRCLREWESLYH